MEILMIVVGILLAYVVFVLVTCWLARVMFPKIEIEDEDLLDVSAFKKLKQQFTRTSGARKTLNTSRPMFKQLREMKSNPQF